MTGFAFRKNMVFEWSGAVNRIDRLQPDGHILLERMGSGQLALVGRDEILQAYARGEIVAGDLPSNDGAARQAAVFSRPLDELKEPVKTKVARRRAYLDAVLESGPPIFTKGYLRPLLEEAAQLMGDEHPPSCTTFWRWYSRYNRHQDGRALIPREDRRGCKEMKLHPRVLELAEAAITGAFHISPRATVQMIFTLLQTKINKENLIRLSSEQLKPPSKRTIYRLLNRMEAYDLTVLREGKAVADKRFRQVQRNMQVDHILERVEIDHTPLDLFLIDERSGLPLGRPTLTMCLDFFSKMPFGYYLSYGAPSTAAVVGALKHAILPKKPCPSALPKLHVEHSWPCYGRPDLIVVDNGLEFHSNDLESIAMDLMIRVNYCPKHEPRFKGAIERYLKTINYFFAHQLPGTSMARLHERGDYDPQKQALLTLSEFNQIFQKWLLDVYAQTVHRGTSQTPWARWHEGLARREPELPSSLDALRHRIGQVVERNLNHEGIVLNGIHYNGDALAPMLRAYGRGTAVRVLFDPDDLGEIHVWGPDAAEPVRVQAMNPAYARGLTALQHTLIRRSVREKGASQQDVAALDRARQELADVVQDLMASRKQRHRHRAAAIQGFNSNRASDGALADRQPTSGQQIGSPRSASPRTEVKRLLEASRSAEDAQRPLTTYPLFTSAANIVVSGEAT